MKRQGGPDDVSVMSYLEVVIGCQFAAAHGLGKSLDTRYKISTVHSTIMRFQSQPKNLPALISQLQSLQDDEIGTLEVGEVDFVLNDWFMSNDKVKLISRYLLLE